MIPEFKEKVNHFYGEQKREIFFITSFFLIGMIGFGLGRVSILAPHKTPIRIIEGPPSVASSPNREYPTETQILAPKGVKIVASKNGAAYYLPWCSNSIKDENKIYFSTEKDAESAGYALAKNCQR
mgnify:FL=1